MRALPLALLAFVLSGCANCHSSDASAGASVDAAPRTCEPSPAHAPLEAFELTEIHLVSVDVGDAFEERGIPIVIGESAISAGSPLHVVAQSASLRPLKADPSLAAAIPKDTHSVTLYVDRRVDYETLSRVFFTLGFVGIQELVFALDSPGGRVSLASCQGVASAAPNVPTWDLRSAAPLGAVVRLRPAPTTPFTDVAQGLATLRQRSPSTDVAFGVPAP